MVSPYLYLKEQPIGTWRILYWSAHIRKVNNKYQSDQIDKCFIAIQDNKYTSKIYNSLLFNHRYLQSNTVIVLYSIEVDSCRSLPNLRIKREEQALQEIGPSSLKSFFNLILGSSRSHDWLTANRQRFISEDTKRRKKKLVHQELRAKKQKCHRHLQQWYYKEFYKKLVILN